MESSTRLDDELAALRAIYDTQFEELPGADERGRRLVRYRDDACAIKFSLPSSYPDGERPFVASLTFYGSECRVNAEGKTVVLKEIEGLVEGNAGVETLFDVIEYLRGRSFMPQTKDGGVAADTVSPISSNDEIVFRAPLPPVAAAVAVSVISGDTTTERKSQFQAHLAFVRSMDEVEAFRYQVCVLDKRCARATHNIFAYRFTCPTTGICHHDYDDDGEDAAGGRVAELLRLMGADGVAVIVSRWFGGILLGPDRFKLINNAARRLLEDHGVGGVVKKR